MASPTTDLIKSKLDIVEFIRGYVTLAPAGKNFKGLCPFHKEKTPSFSVSPSRGIYKCFGCGKRGNAIGFVMDFKKLDYISAVKAIADDHNIILLQEANSKEANEKYNRGELLYSANQLALQWFQDNLKQKEYVTALMYAQSRWNDDMIGDFGIGFAPDKWDGLKNWAKANGIT